MPISDEHMIAQNKAADAAIIEIATKEFWTALGPEMSAKFHHAAKFIFSRGVEFGVRRFAELLQKDLGGKP